MTMNIRIDRYGAIELSGMEFHSFHGCLEEERRDGNTFVVDFLGNMDVLKAARTDDLNNTVDYSKVYRTVAKEMEKPSNLLENVAARIADAIDHEFPEFFFVKVRVSKKNPPVGGTCSWSRVTVTRGSRLLSLGDPHSF